MKTRQTGQKRDRRARTLAMVARCIKWEQIARARRLLEDLRRNTRLDNDTQFEVSLLEIECSRVSRQFSSCQTQIADTRRLTSSARQLERLDVLEAHVAALAGEAKVALQLIVPILRHCPQIGETRARALSVMGLVCYRRGHYRWARTCFELAAAFYRLTQHTKELSHVLINLALVEKSEGQVARALAYLDDAARLVPRHNHAKTRFWLLVNRGICLLKLGDLEGSRNCLMTARTLGAETHEPVFLVMIYNNLGHIYRLERNYAVATEFYEAALALATRERSLRQQCLAHEFLGETLTERGDCKLALEHLNKAYRLASILAPHGDLMMEAARRRGEAQAGLGDTTGAIRDLNRAIDICRSRGEKRELALSQRALVLVSSDAATQFAKVVRDVLDTLHDVGDHFEYARTVCLALENTAAPNLPRWIVEPLATAQHYFAAMNLHSWQRRIQSATGDATRRASASKPHYDTQLINQSQAFARTMAQAQLAASSADPVLIQGETGAGKEVIARLIHSSSDRRDRTFVAINCGAIPENLVESELFGHARGAFTGAGSDKPGLLEAASGGAALLDEIVDLPMQAQVKLLRFLDSGEFRRVGETKARRSDVRIFASTNRDLLGLVEDGKFRSDLYYRLDVFKVHIPPLRQRREDILPLATQFLFEAARGGPAPTVSGNLSDWFLSYEWPGNVRQLRNLCRYMFVRAWGGDCVDVEHLPGDLRSLPAHAGAAQMSTFERERDDLERNQITRALHETHGNISRAALLLGVGRNGLSRRIRTLGIDRASFR